MARGGATLSPTTNAVIFVVGKRSRRWESRKRPSEVLSIFIQPFSNALLLINFSRAKDIRRFRLFLEVLNISFRDLQALILTLKFALRKIIFKEHVLSGFHFTEEIVEEKNLLNGTRILFIHFVSKI